MYKVRLLCTHILLLIGVEHLRVRQFSLAFVLLRNTARHASNAGIIEDVDV